MGRQDAQDLLVQQRLEFVKVEIERVGLNVAQHDFEPGLQDRGWHGKAGIGGDHYLPPGTPRRQGPSDDHPSGPSCGDEKYSMSGKLIFQFLTQLIATFLAAPDSRECMDKIPQRERRCRRRKGTLNFHGKYFTM